MNKIWWIVLVVIIAGAWWIYSNKINLPSYGNPNSVSYGPSPVAGAVVKSTVKKNTPTLTKSYTELVKEYEGRRIQFDDRCQAIPKDPTYKNGTNIMLDNRSAGARTVMVGGAKHDLVAYGYKVITLSASSLPK